MRLYLFLLLFVVTSCGLGMDLPEHDDRFNPIVNQFREDMLFFWE